MKAKEYFNNNNKFKFDSVINLYSDEIIELMEGYAEQKLMEEWDQLEDTYESNIDV